MRARATVLAGAAAALGAVAARVLRRRRVAPPLEQGPDPRADELRRRLDESRAVVPEREEFEAAETPVDEVEPAPDVADRRREIHDRAQQAAEEMRRSE